MGREKRRRGPTSGYLYLSIRTPDGVRKIYFGRGALADDVETALQRRRKDRLEAKKLLQAEKNGTCEASKLAAELQKLAKALFCAWMTLTGHRKHRGQWRKIMPRKPLDQAAKAKRKRDRELIGARFSIKMGAAEARNGKPEGADRVLAWLEAFPELRSEVPVLDELAIQTEAVWAKTLGSGNPLKERGVLDEVASLKAELLGACSSALDRLMAGNVVTAHLAVQRASLRAASANTFPITVACEKLLTNAQRRLVEAVRDWELYSGKKAKGFRPPGQIKIFEAEGA